MRSKLAKSAKTIRPLLKDNFNLKRLNADDMLTLKNKFQRILEDSYG